MSTDDQAEKGLSLDAQCERINAHACAHDCRIVGIERDEGVSGKVPPKKRHGLKRALDMIKRGEADGVVFLKLDRLSRSVRDILRLADDARRRGWHLVSVQESIDSSTAHGKMILTILAALAEMERELVAERTRVGMEELGRRGRARSRIVPFGYRVEGEPDSLTINAGEERLLVEHDLEQRTLREIVGLHSSGLGARRISRRMNERGLINPRLNKPWNPSTVASLLRTVARRERIANVS